MPEYGITGVLKPAQFATGGFSMVTYQKGDQL